MGGGPARPTGTRRSTVPRCRAIPLAIDDPPTIPEYRLTLDVDFEGLAWTGSVEFDLPPGREAVRLDAEDLEIHSVMRNGGRATFRHDPQAQQLEIAFPTPGASNLRVDFAGKIASQRLVGLYRCRHGDGYVLTTQCQPIGARRIFPCIDRPDRKARIALTVRAPAPLEVVSNMPVEQTRDVRRRKEWVFAPTPPMATYLFYFAVGQFDRAEDRSGRVPIGVLTPPGRGRSGAFAAEGAQRILSAYETYYGIDYPLAKLDIIAVSEHAFGAMENWGAMSFRDIRLLIDPVSSSFARSNVFETIAHEIAHQWFGNLVTMAWWDDLWLNESFATFLEAKITDRTAPEFDAYCDFVLQGWGMRAALDMDSLETTHPVRTPVEGPEEIAQAGDAITYGKGASVLRMLDAYLGESEFRAGVTDYLNRFRFRNARTDDLWDALERSAKAPVSSLVGPWVDRPGLPVVHALLRPAGLELTQSRFAYRGSRDEPPWPIPLALDVDGRVNRLLFDTRTRLVPVPASATLHLNPGAVGFYRVHYDPVLYDRLLRVLPDRPAMDRWIVLHDLAAFVLSGTVEWATYARFARSLGVTSDRLVAEEVVDGLTESALLRPTTAAVQEEARSFLADLTDRVGVERRSGEPPATGILRERAMRARAMVDAGFARALAERFVAWDRLDPDLRAAVAIARARTEGAAGYHELRRALERSLSEAEALRLEVALAWSEEPSLVASTLELVRSPSFNRGHVGTVVAHVASNPVGRPLVQPWLERHLPELRETFRGSATLSALLENAIPYAGLGRAEATAAFYRDHPVPDAARGIAKGLERLELFERFRARGID
jgi:tricorn protease interacting factor F2/3